MLYCFIAVTDDIHNGDCEADGHRYKDDDIQLGLDADNCGGNYREGVHGE